MQTEDTGFGLMCCASFTYREAVEDNFNAYFEGLITLTEFVARSEMIALAYPASQAAVDRLVGKQF